jgi:hypothetical protein
MVQEAVELVEDGQVYLVALAATAVVRASP